MDIEIVNSKDIGEHNIDWLIEDIQDDFVGCNVRYLHSREGNNKYFYIHDRVIESKDYLSNNLWLFKFISKVDTPARKSIKVKFIGYRELRFFYRNKKINKKVYI